MNPARRVAFVIGAVLGLFFLTPNLAEASSWNDHRQRCNNILGNPAVKSLDQLKECVALWLTYGSANNLRPVDRRFLETGTKALHKRSADSGDADGVHLSIQAGHELKLQFQPVNMASAPKSTTHTSSAHSSSTKPSTQSKTIKRYKRPKYRCPRVTKSDEKKANSLVNKGVRAFRKNRRTTALRHYLSALEKHPCHLSGLYNAAAEYAYDNQDEKAVELLQRLQDIGNKGAIKRLKATRTDPDFQPIHDSPGFKKATGFARIKMFNSLADVKGYDLGDHELERIENTLNKLKMSVEERGIDKVQGRKRPVVFYKKHSIATAYIIGEVVGHPKTTFREISASIYPNWDTDYDIVVTWGNKIVMKHGEPVPATDLTDMDPAKKEKKLVNLQNAQDKALRKPEQAARKVDKVVATPERLGNKAQRSIDRTTKTINKIGDTMDRIGNL